MYKSFTLRNFRCFSDLTIEPLRLMNLITGKNNVGKTALLEAMWLHHGYHNPSLGVAVNNFRGIQRLRKDEFLWDLFLEFDPYKTIELSSIDTNQQYRSLRITIQEQPITRLPLENNKTIRESGPRFSTSEVNSRESTEPFESKLLFDFTSPLGETFQAQAVVEQDSIRFERPPGIKEPNGIYLAARQRDDLNVLAERFSNLAVLKEQRQIVKILRIVEPDLQELTIQHRGGTPIIFGDVGKTRLMPLPLMGDGVGRLLRIALAIYDAKGGILLVDEIENGLHYTVLVNVWKAIMELARKYEVQIFATTHSSECIQAAHQAFTQTDGYDFRLHRLERVKGAIRSVTYDSETLDAAIETGLEVR